jgi:hypothetical protein
MSGFESIRNRVRSLIGERRPRQVPRRGPKPRIGTHVIQVEMSMRLTVQAGLSDELWVWLMNHGWRVVVHRPERRHYRDIPASWVTRLIDSDPRWREKLLHEAIAYIESKTTGGTGSPA